MKRYSQFIREGLRPEQRTVITIECRDSEHQLEKLLNKIKSLGNIGHSFPIDVDGGGDGGDERGERFFWDGDGSDYIADIKVTHPPKSL